MGSWGKITKRNVEAMGRDETVRGRERVRESSRTELGEIPTIGGKKRTNSQWRQKQQLERPE